MLDYEWVNPSTIILTGNETAAAAAVTDSDQHNYAAMLPHPILHGSTTQNNGFSHHNNHFNFNFNPSPPQPNNNQHHPFFDTRAFQSASSATFSPPPSMLPLNPIAPLATSNCGLGLGLGSGLGLLLMPKSEHAHAMNAESSGHGIGHGPGSGPGLGLNLGGRTYFPSCNDDIAHHRLHHRSVESVPSSNSPRCQAEGCNADLSNAKHYHRRHKVCEYHSKAATVVAAGLTQRFCQQCSRFHLLSEFDNGKRSCRKRLADHNRRRRKNQQQHQQAQEIHKHQPSLDNVARSSPERGAQSWSSLKMKVSPPDYFQEKPNCNNRGSSSTTSNSLFFSTG